MFSHDARNNRATNYFYLGNTLLALREVPVNGGGAATVKYQHSDALGTASAESDASGVVVRRSEYEPYGQLVNRPLTDGPSFTGHVQDAATGLTYMQQRYYDPLVGRFLSVDPVTAYASPIVNFNRYWYASGNPYRFFDPDGRWICPIGGSRCADFEKALNRAASAANSAHLTSLERSALRRAVEFYGTKGDDRVVVSFDNSLTTDGAARLNSDGSHDVIFNPDKLGWYTGDHYEINFARQAIHEGSHGADDVARGRAFESRSERTEGEIGAYSAQAYFQKAVRVAFSSQDGWTPTTGTSLENIKGQAEVSVKAACMGETRGSCQ